MPLIQSKSKAAFKKNVEKEMSAGKPQAQSLAIAYSVKRKPKKKMAEGGMAKNESAKSESRPSPEERDKDSKMVGRNSGDKPASQDSWTSRPDIGQSQRGPKTQALKHPKMVPINGANLRLRDQEDHLQESASVNNGPQHQPPKEDDEIGPDRQGPDVPALHMKKMAKGGIAMEMGKGPEEDRVEHPAGLEEDDDQMRPPQAEYMAGHFARGGEVSPASEIEEEHHNSIAAAIMARRDRLHAEIDSGAHDEDSAVKMADGGILSHDSIYSDDSEQADLKRNAEEDANEEDQLSFNALRKENYSESAGLRQLDSPSDSGQHGDAREEDEENEHDKISKMRSRMNMKRQFSK